MKNKIIIIAVVVAALFGLIKGIEADERFACNGTTVTVQSGDTLWKIAENNCTGNIQVATQYLVKKYTASIDRGQQIQLP